MHIITMQNCSTIILISAILQSVNPLTFHVVLRGPMCMDSFDSAFSAPSAAANCLAGRLPLASYFHLLSPIASRPSLVAHRSSPTPVPQQALHYILAKLHVAEVVKLRLGVKIGSPNPDPQQHPHYIVEGFAKIGLGVKLCPCPSRFFTPTHSCSCPCLSRCPPSPSLASPLHLPPAACIPHPVAAPPSLPTKGQSISYPARHQAP